MRPAIMIIEKKTHSVNQEVFRHYELTGGKGE